MTQTMPKKKLPPKFLKSCDFAKNESNEKWSINHFWAILEVYLSFMFLKPMTYAITFMFILIIAINYLLYHRSHSESLCKLQKCSNSWLSKFKRFLGLTDKMDTFVTPVTKQRKTIILKSFIRFNEQNGSWDIHHRHSQFIHFAWHMAHGPLHINHKQRGENEWCPDDC